MKNAVPFLLKSLVAFVIFSSLLSFFSPAEAGLEKDVLTYTNQYRQSKGLPPLELQSSLSDLARDHSEDMAKKKVGFGHDGFDKRQRQAQTLLPSSSSFAENVAYGAKTGKEAVEMWKNSAGHRRNMLGKYKYVGIGVSTDSKGNTYYTQVFVN